MLKELKLGTSNTKKDVTLDFNRVPHLLVAGSTGSGKSNFIHSMIRSVIMSNDPSTVRLILVDTKYVELGLYDGIPQLFEPVVHTSDDFLNTLFRLDSEIETRLKAFKTSKVRNIEEYNSNASKALPYILIIIDELADLFAKNPKIVDELTRILNISRAVGVHMVLATQRPSSDIISGGLKANVPGRIAFRTASSVDSHIILGISGAEEIRNPGQALYYPVDMAQAILIDTPLISLSELRSFIDSLAVKIQGGRDLADVVPRSLDKMIIGGVGYHTITEADYLMCVILFQKEYVDKRIDRGVLIDALCSYTKATLMLIHMLDTGLIANSAIENEYEWNKGVASSAIGN